MLNPAPDIRVGAGFNYREDIEILLKKEWD